MLQRVQAVVAIRAYGEELRRTVTASGQSASESREQQAAEDAFLAACRRVGVSRDELREALAADRSLAELEAAVIKEAMVGAPDPGPYDVISRESPSGTPANEHLGAYGAAEVGQSGRR